LFYRDQIKLTGKTEAEYSDPTAQKCRYRNQWIESEISESDTPMWGIRGLDLRAPGSRNEKNREWRFRERVLDEEETAGERERESFVLSLECGTKFELKYLSHAFSFFIFFYN
jgi:hypothetical protein